MDRLIAPNSVPLAQADTAPATGTPQYATDGNPATNTPATLWPAYAFNTIQDEIYNVIVAAGLTPDRTKWNQLLTAIETMLQGATTNVGVDTGAANAYVVAFTPALTAPVPWVPFWVKIKTANNGASTLNATGTVEPLVGGAHQALQGGELVANGDALIYWNPTLNSGNGSYVLVFCTGAPEQIAPAAASEHAAQLGQLGHGQCRLSVTNTTTLTIKPYNGNNVIVNGVPLQLPSAGITVSNAGLSASTLYYAYLAGTTASPSLILSATGHVTGTNGVEVMSGDATKTLVGMVYTNASTQFVDTSSSRYCLNWFNRRSRSIAPSGALTATNVTSTSFVEINANNRLSFLTWGDEDVSWAYAMSVANSVSGTLTYGALGIDGATNQFGLAQSYVAQAGNAEQTAGSGATSLVEGQHYMTLLGATNSGGTMTQSINYMNIGGMVRG